MVPATRESDDKRTGAPAVSGAAVAAIGACVVALFASLLAGGAVAASAVPGLPDPGAVTRWGLPLAKQALDIAGALTVGLLILAVVLLPSENGVLSARARAYVRTTSWTALAWAVAAAATLILRVSDVLAMPPTAVLGSRLASYAGSAGQGIALTLVIVLALTVAVLTRTTTSATGALGLLALSLVGLLPPPLTGHSTSAPNHELAVTGIALHVLAVSIWVGGLAALTYHALRPESEELPTAVRRFSRLALAGYIGVAISGTASAASNFYSAGDLLSTPYGRLVLAKTGLFVLLGYLGRLHRGVTIPRLEAGRRWLFARLATVEVAIMAAAMGVAVALSRTEPPTPRDATFDPVRELLGFPMPPPISATTVVTQWRPDLFFGLLVAVLGGFYAAGVLRLRRRGDHWPWGRTVAWFLGLATIVAMKHTGIGTYSMVLFSTHMIQHMVLSMMTPILLVLGGPATLALRALRPAQRRGDRGPREWLTLVLNSTPAHVVTHPGFAAPLFIVSTYALYFTPLFGALMTDHLGHLAMSVHFLLVGYLFYWIIIGVDPAPRKPPHLLRIFLLLLSMGLHAFFGVGLMSLSDPIAMQWYGSFEVPWLASVLEDQRTGGGIAWGVGEIPTLVVLLVLFVQWARDEERREHRRERHSRRHGSDDADMDDYNAYLASLHRNTPQ